MKKVDVIFETWRTINVFSEDTQLVQYKILHVRIYLLFQKTGLDMTYTSEVQPYLYNLQKAETKCCHRQQTV